MNTEIITTGTSNSETCWFGIAMFFLFMWGITLWICVQKFKIRQNILNKLEQLEIKVNEMRKL